MKHLFQAIRYDLHIGIIRKWYIFLPAVVWGLYISSSVDAACMAGQKLGELPSTTAFTFADTCLYAFRGMTLYVPSPDMPFEIPIEWLLWNIYPLFTVSQYPYKNLCGIGQQLLIRFRRRGDWWGGKCVWCIGVVAMIYAVLLSVMALYTGIRGSMSANISPWMSTVVSFPIESGVLDQHALWKLILSTAWVSVTLCQCQTTLVLLFKPLGAFVCTIVFLVAGAYAAHPLLFGNYAMWLRNTPFAVYTFSSADGALVCLGFYGISIVAGVVIFARYDVINTHE